MFDPDSRYFNLKTKKIKGPDGQEIAYKCRRFLPRGEKMPLLVEVIVNQGDRLDQIAARTLGDPKQFWRICDANNTMNPDDLTKEPGATRRIPIPQ